MSSEPEELRLRNDVSNGEKHVKETYLFGLVSALVHCTYCMHTGLDGHLKSLKQKETTVNVKNIFWQ